ncbi:MAG: prolipoprotein diacylglyceryl transferase [Candidatus Zixiibacteriota bacterium]
MLPELFHIGPFVLRSYGLLLALSFLIGLWLVHREAKVVGVDPDRAVNLGFVLILFGVIGGRLAYVLYHLRDFADQPWEVINPFHTTGHFGIAGLNLQGGLIVGTLAGFVYLRRHRIRPLPALDAVAPAVAFGIGLSRIGCFLNGCCFGTPTGAFCGVHYPPDAPAAIVFAGQAVHPTQLYSSVYGFLLFLVLSRVNRRHHWPGLTAGLFFMIEALFRFLIEPFRYYETEMWLSLAGLRVNYNQLIAVAMFVAGALLAWLPRRLRGKTP